jgi:hypothetical protein
MRGGEVDDERDEWGRMARDVIVEWICRRFGTGAVPVLLSAYAGRDREICRKIGSALREKLRQKGYRGER